MERIKPRLAITLVPFEGAHREPVGWLAADLRRMGHRVRTAAPLALPAGGCGPVGGRCDASLLLRQVIRCRERHCLGVTERDLYAGGLNFVFGIAQVPGHAAVISLARLRSDDSQRFRERMLKEAMHELGHTLGLEHCPRPECVMYFSNSLAETDRKSWEFCASCAKAITA